jgi:hypothetical protein
MDFIWTLYELCGVHEDFMWTMGSLWGVHGNLWGTVKYSSNLALGGIFGVTNCGECVTIQPDDLACGHFGL